MQLYYISLKHAIIIIKYKTGFLFLYLTDILFFNKAYRVRKPAEQKGTTSFSCVEHTAWQTFELYTV